MEMCVTITYNDQSTAKSCLNIKLWLNKVSKHVKPSETNFTRKHNGKQKQFDGKQHARGGTDSRKKWLITRPLGAPLTSWYILSGPAFQKQKGLRHINTYFLFLNSKRRTYLQQGLCMKFRFVFNILHENQFFTLILMVFFIFFLNQSKCVFFQFKVQISASHFKTGSQPFLIGGA